MIKLFLSPAGRMGRRNFWIGVVGFILFVVAMQTILRLMAPTLFQFFLSLIYIVLVFQILYSVYGKRLHDIGRSFWALTGMITLTILIVMAVMLTFGGAEYFTEFAQYDRKEDIDPAEIERIKSAYQIKLANAGQVMQPALYGIWAIFTLWLGLSKPNISTNKYGPAILE